MVLLNPALEADEESMWSRMESRKAREKAEKKAAKKEGSKKRGAEEEADFKIPGRSHSIQCRSFIFTMNLQGSSYSLGSMFCLEICTPERERKRKGRECKLQTKAHRTKDLRKTSRVEPCTNRCAGPILAVDYKYSSYNV